MARFFFCRRVCRVKKKQPRRKILPVPHGRMVLNVQDFAYDIGIFAGLGLGMYAMNQLLGQRLSDTNALKDIRRSSAARLCAPCSRCTN